MRFKSIYVYAQVHLGEIQHFTQVVSFVLKLSISNCIPKHVNVQGCLDML